MSDEREKIFRWNIETLEQFVTSLQSERWEWRPPPPPQWDTGLSWSLLRQSYFWETNIEKAFLCSILCSVLPGVATVEFAGEAEWEQAMRRNKNYIGMYRRYRLVSDHIGLAMFTVRDQIKACDFWTSLSKGNIACQKGNMLQGQYHPSVQYIQNNVPKRN